MIKILFSLTAFLYPSVMLYQVILFFETVSTFSLEEVLTGTALVGFLTAAVFLAGGLFVVVLAAGAFTGLG
jgi:hypothetical protein